MSRFFRLLAQSDPTTTTHPTGPMIADAVRYMSVHSWKQPDSHGHSGTSPGQKQQPARPGKPSSRAISAGGGRCWVRTSVGLADGFTVRNVPWRGRPAGVKIGVVARRRRTVLARGGGRFTV